MKQSFVTVYGKAIIENNTLFIRLTDVPFSRSTFAAILREVVFVLVFILQFFREDEIKQKIGIVVWGLLMIFELPKIYELVFKRSYSNRIPIQNIQSFKSHDHINGLETIVTLYLKSGRQRVIPFRKLENQTGPFLEMLSQYLSIPKYA